jgi:hypothetical protein
MEKMATGFLDRLVSRRNIIVLGGLIFLLGMYWWAIDMPAKAIPTTFFGIGMVFLVVSFFLNEKYHVPVLLLSFICYLASVATFLTEVIRLIIHK